MIPTLIRHPAYLKIFLLLASSIQTACQSHPPQTPMVIEEIREADLAKMREQNNPEENSASAANTLSQEELTHCANRMIEFKKGTEQMKTEDHALATQKLELSHQAQQLENIRAKVNFKNKKQIDRFNQRLEQYKTAVNEFNARVTQLKSKENQLNIHNKAFTAECTQRSYRYSDLIQLDPLLRKAVETGSGLTDHPTSTNEPFPEKTIEIPKKSLKP